MSARGARPPRLLKISGGTKHCLLLVLETLCVLAVVKWIRYTYQDLLTHISSNLQGSSGKLVNFLAGDSCCTGSSGERTSLGTSETVEKIETQPQRGDREAIVVRGSAAGLFTAASVARGGRRGHMPA